MTKQTDTLRIAHSAMGCEWEISCWGRSNSYLRAACEQAFEAIDSIEEQLSVYRFASEVSRINHLAAGDDVLVDPVTFALLRRAVVLSQRTRGAFDITVGPLIKFWAMCKKQNRIPAQEEIAQVLKLIGRDHIQLDESAKTVRFGREGVEINMGAYGKGCAVDRAADIMLETDIPGAVVHSGFSTVMALGKAPNGEPWRVGIKHPREKNNRIAEVSLENQALSTSGDCEQYFEIGGRRFGHVIDPRSGWSVNETLSATVICESAAVSDALSTAAMVLGKTDFDAIIAGEPGIQAIIHPATDMSRPPDAIRKHMI